ncbi:MAG TPA: FMN-binding protein [Methylomusa anaerophila]|uniref:FMN-binding domain protein n=1 Tax=Methylomusa anaerophila TaxID=1930071 RepID=A0A348ANB8_9FIRM|nr:FMN-binding protein [Methylomusa anaerophila]BBB92566.1 FMN-binding domain protein [Methylomusa anaerophila]HML87578.1 FMN-binding protein [Methylomusa anaerophila]
MSNDTKPKRKIKMWVVLLIIFGVLIVGAAGGFLADAPGRHEIQELVIQDVDFKKLRDGTYEGAYTGTKSHSRDTQVEVTISGGGITAVKILKGALDKTGKPAELTGGLSIEDLFGNVIEAKTLQVDTISGATLTSKAHLKALENALKQAQGK